MTKRKKSIFLEDLFFKSNKGTIYEIMDEMLKYDEIIFRDEYYDAVVNPGMLNEYIARYDTYADAGLLLVNYYDIISIFHIIYDLIKSQAEDYRSLCLKIYAREPFDLGENLKQYDVLEQEYLKQYDGISLNINVIDRIIRS